MKGLGIFLHSVFLKKDVSLIFWELKGKGHKKFSFGFPHENHSGIKACAQGPDGQGPE